jgi:hypothetical protein
MAQSVAPLGPHLDNIQSHLGLGLSYGFLFASLAGDWYFFSTFSILELPHWS